MKKVLLSVVFTALVFAPISFAQNPPPAEAPAAVAAPAVETAKPAHHHEHGKHFPELHKAMRKLRGAKQDLEKAHDLGDHKAKALEAIDRAIEELHDAMGTDTK